MGKTIIAGFVAGCVAVLAFHQGTAFLLHHFGNGVPAVTGLFGTTQAPFRLVPVPPLGVPAVVSVAFWGGVWGIALALILRRAAVPDLLFGFVFGAVVTTLVAFTVVASLKGLPLFAGGNKITWWCAGLLDGAWGWGTALLLRAWPRQG